MEEKLVFVKNLGKLSDEVYEYYLYFSDKPNEVWGIDWDIYAPINCPDLEPEESTISSKVKIRVKLPFKTAQELSEFSMEYCTYGMLALSWIDIENLEEYPENGRCVLNFGDTKEKAQKLTEPYIIN